MSNKPRITVAYLEPVGNPAQPEKVIARDGLKACFEAFFEATGLAADISFVEGADEVIVDALNGRLDIFICDLSLNDNAPSGLGVIGDVKEACPWLYTIATSRGQAFRFTEIDSHPRSFDLFIPKGALTARAFAGTPDYIDRFRHCFRYSPVRTFRFADRRAVPDEERGISVTRDNLLPLLRQIISYKLPLEPAVLCSDVVLEPLGGGRSASRVFVLRLGLSPTHQPAQPAVLKVASREDAGAEARNYDTFVRWALPHQVRVDLLAHATTRAQGAVAYSFAYGDAKISTLKSHLEAGDFEKSKAAIDVLLNSIGSFWLALSNSQAHGPLPRRFMDRYYRGSIEWFNNDAAKIVAFVDRLGLPIKDGMHSVSIGSKQYPNLSAFLQNGDGVLKINTDNEWSIVHGDLNPGNIVISSDGDIALIDFRDAGIGHRFEDYVTLEASIRMFWAWAGKKQSASNLFIDSLEAECALGSGDMERLAGERLWEIIILLRARASQSCGGRLPPSYFFSLAFYCFRLMRIEDVGDATRVRLLAAAYAAAARFEEIK